MSNTSFKWHEDEFLKPKMNVQYTIKINLKMQ